MPETDTKTCECGKPATTTVVVAYSRVAYERPACEACKLKWECRVDVDGKKPSEICDALAEILKREGLQEEGVYCSARWDPGKDQVITKYRWIVCYAVTGTNEGHYVHIDLHLGYRGDWRGEIINIGTIKTFNGWDKAWEVAKRTAFLLSA